MLKVLKTIGKVVGIIILVLLVILIIIFIKNKIHERQPWIDDDYYKDFKSDSPLEQKYADCGELETAHAEYKTDSKTIDTVRIYYPKELETSGKTYPMIVYVNASNTRALNFLPFMDRLASWGFIVVGNDDPQTGNGRSTSETLDYVLDLKDSPISGKIDKENIGIIGYSQGGAGAICAATNFENSKLYKTIFTGSAAYPFLAKNMGWEYDPSKIGIPYFMTSGTGKSDDAGVVDISKDFAGVCPLESVISNYNAISEDVEKVRGRISGAEHGDMLTLSDGYMTAWMRYQLMGDEEAAKVFVGDDAELIKNKNWQDIQKNN